MATDMDTAMGTPTGQDDGMTIVGGILGAGRAGKCYAAHGMAAANDMPMPGPQWGLTGIGRSGLR